MPTPPFKVKAVFEYTSPHGDDLTFSNGQIITVTEEEDGEWYSGEYVDVVGKKQEGMFPRNFVEKYEPEVPTRPSRPSRQRKETEPAPPPEPVAAHTAPESVGEPEPEREEPVGAAPPPKDPEPTTDLSPEEATPPSQAQLPPQRSISAAAPKSAPQAAPKPVTSKPPPPTPAEKPTSGSFRDRIAAFNSAAAAPIAPFKPGGQSGGTGFIKKPFVAPPPSKNAYVPPPRDLPQKFYRREEDPAVPEHVRAAEPEAHTAEITEPTAEEDQPKPTSLKERIALLQKQQAEQAARHAEPAQKKDKPKRPPRKRTESHEPGEPLAEPATGADSEKAETQETAGKTSIDMLEDTAAPTRHAAKRQASMVGSPPAPSRELMSDTNDADYSGAGDTEEAEASSTSKEDSDDKPGVHAPVPTWTGVTKGEEQEEADEGEGDAEEEEEDDVDPEVRRRLEIRERMAKMSGGMGMMGMFAPPGTGAAAPGPRKPKPSGESARKSSEGQRRDREETPAQAPPVPIMVLPGMQRAPNPPPEADEDADDNEQAVPTSKYRTPAEQATEDNAEELQPPSRRSTDRAPPPPPPQARNLPPPLPTDARGIPPPLPGDRPSQPPPPLESRPPPQIPLRPELPLTPGQESDDEMSMHGSRISLDKVADDSSRPQTSDGPPVATMPPAAAPQLPNRPAGPRAPNPPSRASTMEMASPNSPNVNDKRISRGPPPIPQSPTIASPTQSRPPPPPPPGQPPTRRLTDDRNVPPTHLAVDDSDEEVTEYEGDYDTDIASGAKHKDALKPKSHGRESSLEDNNPPDEPSQEEPSSPPNRGPPPLPAASAPRAVPRPPPSAQPPKSNRRSMDMPRAVPPPVPSQPPPTFEHNDYDPYNYSAPQGPTSPGPGARQMFPSLQSPQEEPDEDDLYDATPVQTHMAQAPQPTDRAPLPPPAAQPPQGPPPARSATRQSMDLGRSNTMARRSMEQSRPAGDQGFIASDLDLGENSLWWSHPNEIPPTFAGRKDILHEVEESTSSKRGGKTTISKDIYILYMDYSQTVITATFDATNPSDVKLEQRHERPPPPLRQDQLENASVQFGARIAEQADKKQNTTVGDGVSYSLVIELMRPLASVLLPVGVRAYGALVYANLANATVQQHDEIRAGDVVTFRNAKFQGHKGTMHQKYAVDVGKPDHVGVVVDWDGTKKKIRAWEQGRDSRKVKMESFKLGDLRSGEVRVWRVMGRRWVGWESEGGGK